MPRIQVDWRRRISGKIASRRALSLSLMLSTLLFQACLTVLSLASAQVSEGIVVGKGEKMTIRGRVLVNPGDIIVEEGGTLVIRDAEIYFNHTGYYEHGILLRAGTRLEVYNSSIIGLKNLYFLRAEDTTLIVEDSTLMRTHVIVGNRSQIEFRRSYLWTLHCLNDSHADVCDSELYYLFLQGTSSARVENTTMIEILLYESSVVNVSDSTLRFIFFLDEGYATISNCDYEDVIRFKPRECELIVQVLDEKIGEPLSDVKVTLNKTGGPNMFEEVTGEGGSIYFSEIEEGDYFVGLSREGYISLTARVSVLNETHRETLLMERIEKTDFNPQGSRGLSDVFPAAVTLAGFVMLLLLFYRLEASEGV